MTTPATRLQSRAADLRRAFDREFAEVPRTSIAGSEDLLAVRIGGDPYALRVSELSGLASGRKVVPLPTSRSELVGLAGMRASLVPVYSLSVLLGYAAVGSTRWLALCGRADPVALAFDEVEGFTRVLHADLRAATRSGSRLHLSEVIYTANASRPIVDTRSTLRALEVGAGDTGSTKEH